jgi:di/tricarboxylate transporter
MKIKNNKGLIFILLVFIFGLVVLLSNLSNDRLIKLFKDIITGVLESIIGLVFLLFIMGKVIKKD